MLGSIGQKTQLINEFFPFPLGSGILVTTRHGGWNILSNDEYQLLKSGKINEGSELFKKLEEAGIILTPKGMRKAVNDLRIQNNYLYLPTAYHVIAVNNQCNFNCIYCHPDATPRENEMKIETAKKVLDFIFSIPIQKGCQIIIEGGEPLLKWDLVKFIFEEGRKRAKEKNLQFRFSFTTNLSLMTDKIAKEIQEMGITPCVSFDGPKDLHNKHRPFVGGEGSYDKVIYWFKKLKNDYKINVHAIPVITNISLQYGPEAIIDEYLKIGEKIIFFKPFRASGRALSSFQELKMEPEDFYNFWKKGVEYCLALNKKGIEVRELDASYFITNILSPQRRSMCHRRPCGAGFSILSYNYDGTINGCDATRGQGFLDLGHVDKDDYPAIRSRALPLATLSPDLTPICSSCPFMAYCRHCLSDVYGRENGLYPKIPRSFECHWQKAAFEYLFKKISEDSKDAQILLSWRQDHPEFSNRSQSYVQTTS